MRKLVLRGPGYFVMAGKEEAWKYSEGAIFRCSRLEQADSLVDDLKKEGYTQFHITKEVKRLHTLSTLEETLVVFEEGEELVGHFQKREK
ncbi:hypothetical protein BH753_gp162 [Bacillus phage Shbh1]|uniref:Uncharacterized protein n=1 Tax=Bacillus phage Shbh1 TaxID=1796992 RepID=A0A142F1I7_9CAUD|nr:hypothetical protein BH753_gp162 [Bacillus phage Shbh1]AMQ66644.1 hypothetical protein [Bacillus phage Shbh1]